MSDVTELKWKRKESIFWQTNNTIEKDLIKDTYTVEFQPHRDFEDITDVEIELLPNQLNTIEVSTKRKAEVGSVKINIFPKVLSTEGVKWRVKGTDIWYASEETQNDILIGLKEIEFQLNEYTRINEPLKLNILRDHVTEINYILILSGTPNDVIEDVFLEAIETLNCNKRSPLSEYQVIFSGASGIINPDEYNVEYGKFITVEFNAGYKFKLGGIINDITVTGNKIQELTETSLTTDTVYNDSYYSFNIQWINLIKEELCITSDYQFAFSKTKGKPKQLEDVGILSISETTVQIRKAFIEAKIEEEIGNELVSVSSLNHRVLKLSELPYDSVHVGCDKVISLNLRNQLKSRSFDLDIGIMSDMILSVEKRDTRKVGTVDKVDIIVGSDIITSVDRTVLYQSYNPKEEIAILSADIPVSVEKQNPLTTKNRITTEEISLKSIITTAIDKHNIKFLTPVSINEEVGITSDGYFSFDKKEKENKVILPIEEIGIEMSTIEVVDITTKIKPQASPIDEIGILSNTEISVDIINKATKISISKEEVGNESANIISVDKKTTNAIIKNLSSDEIVSESGKPISVSKHDPQLILNDVIEEPISLTSVSSVSIEKKDPRYERINHVEDISIEAHNIEEFEKRIAAKKNTTVEEHCIKSDTILRVDKYRKLEKTTFNENIGINSAIVNQLDIISHLVKSNLSDENYITSITSFEAVKKSHLIKNTFEDEAYIDGGSVKQVDRKSHLLKPMISSEEIGIESNSEVIVDLTTVCKTSTVNEDIGILSVGEISIDKQEKDITNEHKEEVAIESITMISVEKNIP